MSRATRRFSVGAGALCLAGAFAVGAIPTGRLVTRALTGQELVTGSELPRKHTRGPLKGGPFEDMTQHLWVEGPSRGGHCRS